VSYDLYVVPVSSGEDPGEALERLEEETPDSAALEQMGRIASAIQARLPQLERHEGDGFVELLGALEIVRAQTGWSIYDPQLDRLVTTDDLSDILGIHAQGVAAVRSIAEEEKRPTGFLRRLFGRGP
jgi:hypothetical protein